MTLWQFPSFKYRHRIKKQVSTLSDLPHFAAIAVAIVLDSGKSIWLSSMPHIALKNFISGQSRGELLLNPRFLKAQSVLFPQAFTTVDDIQKKINNIIESEGIFRAYCLVKSCQDCRVVIAYNVDHKPSNPQKIYSDTHYEVQLFTADFINEFLPVYLEALPELASSRFATDKAYRTQVLTLKEKPNTAETLSNRDIDLLYWSAQGKTAEEISLILGLSKNTVDSYRRVLLSKMQVSNITQAVHEASKLGLIV